MNITINILSAVFWLAFWLALLGIFGLAVAWLARRLGVIP